VRFGVSRQPVGIDPRQLLASIRHARGTIKDQLLLLRPFQRLGEVARGDLQRLIEAGPKLLTGAWPAPPARRSCAHAFEYRRT
jgi:hypothetical protein